MWTLKKIWCFSLKVGGGAAAAPTVRNKNILGISNQYNGKKKHVGRYRRVMMIWLLIILIPTEWVAHKTEKLY